MNILVITQMYSQPDDVGDNKPTKTVNYFVKEWIKSGNSVVVVHCPSKFPLLLYCIPKRIKERYAGNISTMVPPITSRKCLEREENGAKVYRIPMLKMLPGQGYSSFKMKCQSRRIQNELKSISFRPDLVVGHFANPSLELVAILADVYGAKSSIVFHQDCSLRNIKKYRISQNVSRIGAVGARSIIEANQIKASLNLDYLPFVCYSGAPNESVASAQRICKKHEFSSGIHHIYVGSFIKRKHLDVVVKAFWKTANEKDTLTIVGGGPEEAAIRVLIDELQAEKQITLCGRVSRQEVMRMMGEAQVFTLISHGETFGMVYIEAMLQGCLTIASKGGGFDGIIQDGVNGFLCDAGNQDELEMIYRRITNLTSEERNRIGQSAIDTAIHFSESEVAERYLQDILDNQR